MLWLRDSLKQEVRRVFEPKYHRKLTDLEVITIAENLTEVMETFLKMKWRVYEKSQIKKIL